MNLTLQRMGRGFQAGQIGCISHPAANDLT